MLVSLNWIRDFVELPRDIDPRELGERITLTTAEVEAVRPITTGARGLIVAGVLEVQEARDAPGQSVVTLDIGNGTTVETVSAAPGLAAGAQVIFAPVGASTAATGEIKRAKVAGRVSEGMIPPGSAVGIAMAEREAVLVGDEFAPGDALLADLFDDWVIEIDNKSLTHRPDLWGHRGIAREVAAIFGVELGPYPVVPTAELGSPDLPSIEIDIEDGGACRRYSALRLAAVPTKPAPLWMQLRLGRVGLRPISALVDLTNYVMLDLGQPMHAFDGDRVNQIEVAWAKSGEVFRALDGVERRLTDKTLMIQCAGESIALAGIMGGLDTEVGPKTQSLLLESANFDAGTIRRAAVHLGLRTDASARFEKSLDPSNTECSIGRFIHLAKACYADLQITGRFCDCYPNPFEPVTVSVSPAHLSRMVGRDVPTKEVHDILRPLGFEIDAKDDAICVTVPSFRATGDVSVDVDVIEEVSRYIGYNNIPEVMPRMTARRFARCAIHDIERQTIEYFCKAARFNEIHGYLWHSASWMQQIGYDPGDCIELANPAAEGLHRLRRTLVPGLLAALTRNRFFFSSCALLEVGSAFKRGREHDRESREVALLLARRTKRAEGQVVEEIKTAIEGWAWDRFGRPVAFGATAVEPARPWERSRTLAAIQIDGRLVGRVGAIDLSLRQKMDEHLAAWSIAWAEIRLSGLESLDAVTETMGTIPPYPLVEMDFSILVPRATSYAETAGRLAAFEHPLLRRITYVGSYEGASIGTNQWSLTVRVVVGNSMRTLVEDDSAAFRTVFERHVRDCGYELRA